MSAAPSGCDEATAAAWPTLALGGSPWVAGGDHAHCVVSSSHSWLVAIDAGELEFAAEAFRGALALEPAHAKANYYMALVYGRQQRYAEALAHVEQTLRTQPDFPDAAQMKEGLIQALRGAGK